MLSGILLLLNLLFVLTEANLSPGGSNVCRRTVYYNANERRRHTRVAYSNYRTCCRRFLGICTSRCTRYRTYQESYYQNHLVRRQRIEYYCCYGWSRSGSQCPNPICSPGCRNGRCVRPYTCSCNQGFAGKYCENDINECLQVPCSHKCTNLPGSYSCSCNKGFTKSNPSNPKDGKCNDIDECKLNTCKCATNNPGCKAKCNNLVGSFKCSCNKGFQLQYDGKICNDINECSKPNHGCQHNCNNNPGSFYCSCRSGFLLDANKKSCNDINECETLNGGCNQICRNDIGSYKCNCKLGYRLSTNQKTCVDIDECSEKKPCDNNNGICQNILGSYRCSCKIGYRLLPDRKTCIDRNECENKGSNDCSQNCHNTIGSYTCSCKPGYRLNKNARKCDDVDECFENKHNCQHVCHNKVGSFSCSCNPGFKLKQDGSSCEALPCLQLTAPLNGNIACSGHVTFDHCNFTCNAGYDLIGLSRRQCQTTSVWSDVTVKCTAMKCPAYNAPLYGTVILPCYETFGSTCGRKCSTGYYMKGEAISECQVQNSKTFWTPDNFTCIKSTPCQPDPCSHGSTCSAIDAKTFQCECDNKRYKGKRCEQIIATIDPIPQGEVQQKIPIVFNAKPDSHVIIRVKSKDKNIVFDPPQFSIVYPGSKKEFSIVALKSGKYEFNYELSGQDSPMVIPPEKSVVYIAPPKPKLKLVNITSNIYDKTCQTFQLMSMKCNNKYLKYETSCKDIRNGGIPTFTTSNGAKLPIAQIPIPGSDLYRTSQYVNFTSKLDEYFIDNKVYTCQSSCPNILTSSDVINYLNRYGYFPRTVTSAISNILPHGISLEMTKFINLPTDSMIVHIGNGERVGKLLIDQSLKKDVYYLVYETKVQSQLHLLNERIDFSNNNKPGHIIYDLCQGHLYLSPLGGQVDVKPDIISKVLGVQFDSFKLKRMIFEDKSFVFSIDAKLKYPRLLAEINGNFGISMENVPLKQILTNQSKFNTKFSGILKGTLKIPILNGKNIELVLDDNAGSIIGESYPKINDNDRIVLSSKARLQIDTSILKFLPKDIVSLNYLSRSQRSQIIGLEEERIIFNHLRLFKSIDRLSEQLFSKMKLNNDFESLKIIEYHYNKSKHVASKLQTIFQDKKLEYLKMISMLEVLKSNAFDFINSLETYGLSNPQLAFQIVNLKRRLERYLFMNVDPKLSPMSFQAKKILLTYTGEFCYYKLCLRDALINLEENTLTDSSFEHIIISISPQSKTKLSNRITMSKEQKMILTINKNEDVISGTLKANVRILSNLEKELTFIISKEKIRYHVNDFELSSHFKFNITGDVNTDIATWDSLVYNIKGECLDTTQLAQTLQSIFEEQATSTMSRVKANDIQFNKANKNFNEYQEQFDKVSKRYDPIEKMFLKAKALHARTVLQLRKNQTAMDRYLKLHPQLVLLIEKNVDSICKIEKCKRKCLPMPICEICQEEVTVPTTVMKCKQRIEKVRTNRLEQMETTCNLKRYRFTTVYTGDCPNPSFHGAQTGDTKKGLIGAAIGGLVAGPVGAFVGFLVGLFSSCDKSYEVKKSSYNIQQKCVKLKSVIKTIDRPYSVCYDEPIDVKTGFGMPQKCKCRVVSCSMKLEDPVCITKNIQCQKKRKQFMQGNLQLPKFYLDLRNSIEKLQEEADTNRIILDRMTLNKNEAEFKLKETTSFFKKVKQEAIFANKTKENIQIMLYQELCQAKLYEKYKNISNIININKITFDTNLPITSNIDLFVRYKSQLDGTVSGDSLIYDITYTDIFRPSKRLLSSIVCRPNRRRRRSIEDDKNDRDSLVKSIARESCLKLKKSLQFLGMTSKTSTNILKGTEKTKVKDVAIQALISLRNEGISSPILQAQKSLIEDYRKEIEEKKNQQNITNLIKTIIQDMEVLVSLQNNTQCLNFMDCLQKAFDDLDEIPLMERPLENYGKPTTFVMKIKALDIFNLVGVDKLDFNEVLKFMQDLSKFLDSTAKASYHCSQPPKIVSVTIPQLNVQKGEAISLDCKVGSDAPTKIVWFKDGRPVDGEDSPSLVINTTTSSTGSYKCLASSKIGESYSNETLVFVYKKPEFLEEPQDFDYILPADSDSPSFFCNATGNPEPKIQWLLYNDEQDLGKVVKSNESPQFDIKDPKYQDDGFIACSATNQFGTIISRKARLRVVNGAIASQRLVIKIKNLSNDTIKNLLNQNLRLIQENDGQKIDIKTKEDQVHFQIFSKPADIAPVFQNRDGMLDLASKTRRDLANAAAKFIKMVPINKSEDLSYENELNICEEGYQIHENNFMCVPCFPGRAGNNCTLCPLGSYQTKSGMKTCIKCANDKITRQQGATSQKECFSVDSAIIFIIDTSLNNNLKPIKLFLQKTVNQVSQVSSKPWLKIALVSYSSSAKVLFGFNDSIQDFQNVTTNIRNEDGWRYLYMGIHKADQLLSTLSERFSNRFVVVVTSGKVDGTYHHSGFSLARNASLNIQNNHKQTSVYCVSTLDHLHDTRTLHGIASYPKKSHTVIGKTMLAVSSYPKQINRMVRRNWKETQRILVEKIEQTSRQEFRKQEYRFDFGILFSEHPLQLHYNLARTLKFLTKLQLVLPYSKYSFYQGLGRAYYFRRYRSQRFYDAGRRCLYEVMVSSIRDSVVLLNGLLNNGFNEDRNSLSPRKVIILFSTHWISLDELKKVKRFYPVEKFLLINVIYDQNYREKARVNIGNMDVVYLQHFQVQNAINILNNRSWDI